MEDIDYRDRIINNGLLEGEYDEDIRAIKALLRMMTSRVKYYLDTRNLNDKLRSYLESLEKEIDVFRKEILADQRMLFYSNFTVLQDYKALIEKMDTIFHEYIERERQYNSQGYRTTDLLTSVLKNEELDDTLKEEVSDRELFKIELQLMLAMRSIRLFRQRSDELYYTVEDWKIHLFGLLSATINEIDEPSVRKKEPSKELLEMETKLGKFITEYIKFYKTIRA